MIEEGDMSIMSIKITFLAAVVVALFGVSAASASASLFLAAEYPVLVKGEGGLQTFEAGGATSVCHKILATSGPINGPTSLLLIHPVYEGHCNVTIGTVNVLAKVLTTGCNYVFHAALSLTKEGSVDIECETGKEIQIELEGTLIGCVISVKSQTGLKTVDYMNNDPSAGKVKVEAAVQKIKWAATSLCGIALNGEEAKYTGTANAEGEKELGGSDALTVD